MTLLRKTLNCLSRNVVAFPASRPPAGQGTYATCQTRCCNTGSKLLVDPVQKLSFNENCILVDEEDNAIGYASKEMCHTVNGEHSLLLHRAFSVFIFNSKNEMLLQKRASTKITFPDQLTNACCSHPLHDIACERNAVEGAKVAAQRRLMFELGIPKEQCDPRSMIYLTRLHYKHLGDGLWGEHEIDYIFILRENVDVRPNYDEVSKVLFVSKDDLRGLIASRRHVLTPWFELMVQHWLPLWWDNLHQLHKFQDFNTIHKLQ